MKRPNRKERYEEIRRKTRAVEQENRLLTAVRDMLDAQIRELQARIGAHITSGCDFAEAFTGSASANEHASSAPGPVLDEAATDGVGNAPQK
jgi:hypothetical protein